MGRFTTALKVLTNKPLQRSEAKYLPPYEVYGQEYRSLVESDAYRGYQGIWGLNMGEGGRDIYFTHDDQQGGINAFKKCAPLNAIITRKASAYINGKIWILDKKGKESNSNAAVRVRDLINTPNVLQSKQEFIAQKKIYQYLYGYNILLTSKPVGFDNTYATAMWNLPPQFIHFEYENKSFWNVNHRDELIKNIWFVTPDGNKAILDKKAITIQKAVLPSFDLSIIPISPIKSNEQQINNIIGAYESRGILIHQRGALGILSQQIDPAGTAPLLPDQKEQIQHEFMQYGIAKGQYKFIIAPQPMNWQPMGIPTKDLMLFEEIKDDVERLCDNQGYPFELLSHDKGTTFANKNEASKLLYQNTIIPDAIIDDAGWDAHFGLPSYGLLFNTDFGHVPVLQENKREAAGARNTMGVALERDFKNNFITYNRVLELMEEDTIGADGEKYYKDLLAEGWVFGDSQNKNFDNGQEDNATGNAGADGAAVGD